MALATQLSVFIFLHEIMYMHPILHTVKWKDKSSTIQYINDLITDETPDM